MGILSQFLRLLELAELLAEWIDWLGLEGLLLIAGLCGYPWLAAIHSGP